MLVFWFNKGEKLVLLRKIIGRNTQTLNQLKMRYIVIIMISLVLVSISEANSYMDNDLNNGEY